MLILFSFLILFMAAATILLLRVLRPDFNYSWLIAALAALLSLISLAFLRIRLPQMAELLRWASDPTFITSPTLFADKSSWVYAFTIGILGFSVIMTSVAREQTSIMPLAWAFSLVMSGLGLLAVFGENYVTAALAWTAMDLLSLTVLSIQIDDQLQGRKIVMGFSIQVLGTFLVVWAGLTAQMPEITPVLPGLPLYSNLALLLGLGLRLGVLPFYLPGVQANPLSRGLGTLLRLVPAASALALLTKVPAGATPQNWLVPLQVLAMLTGVYGAVMWLLGRDELSARPFWTTAMAAISILTVLGGRPEASMAWGVALLLGGGTIFLYSLTSKWMVWITLLEGLLLFGLPFSPTASGWITPFSINAVLFNLAIVIILVILLAGYVRHVLRERPSLVNKENWVQVIYPIGLVIFPITHIMVGLFGWENSKTIGVWWLGLLTLLLFAGGIVIVWARYSRTHPSGGNFIDFIPRGDLLSRLRLKSLLSLEWLYLMLTQIYKLLNWLISGTSVILEGDGGVMWALVLLILFLSLIQPGMIGR